jgi:hypothetical protein
MLGDIRPSQVLAIVTASQTVRGSNRAVVAGRFTEIIGEFRLLDRVRDRTP